MFVGKLLWYVCLTMAAATCFAGETAVLGTAPVRIEKNALVLAATGQRFEPRGFNLIRLDLEGRGGHATFSPFVYDRERTSTTLRQMASGGYNVVRVFINGFWGRRGTLLENAEADALSAAYLDNLADFLLQAGKCNVLVIPCFEGFPEAGPYGHFLTTQVEHVQGASRNYLHPGFIAAKKAYLQDVIRGLRARDPATLRAVFCWDIMNEVCFPLSGAPFALDQGMVTPANGITYDLAIDKQRLADEMAIYWVDQIVEAIRSEVPDALINANLFTYHAVGRTGPGDFHQDQALWKNRYPFRPTALLRSKADVIDIHFYSDSEEALNNDLASVEHEALLKGLAEQPGKALLVGEFGAFKTRFPQLPPAAKWASTLAAEFPKLGFQGWLYWTYDTDEQKELWNGMSGDGVIFRALSPRPGGTTTGLLPR